MNEKETMILALRKKINTALGREKTLNQSPCGSLLGIYFQSEKVMSVLCTSSLHALGFSATTAV